MSIPLKMTHLTRKEDAGGGEEPLCLASYGPAHVVLHALIPALVPQKQEELREWVAPLVTCSSQSYILRH